MSSSEPSSSRASSPEPLKKKNKASSAKTGKSKEIVEKKKKRKLPEPSSDSDSDDEEEVKGGSSAVEADAAGSGSDDDDDASEGGSGSEDGDKDGDDNADDKMEDDDTPALSHAERRRRKKAEKRAAAAATADEETGSPKKKRKLADGSAETTGEKKDKKGKKEEDPAKLSRKNSVWVGNLSFKTTTDDLKRFFSAAGEVTRVNMPTKAGNIKGTFENRGFAYVDFATETEQTIAIGLSEQPLLGRKLLIKNGNDFAGRPAAPEVSISDPAIAAKTHTKSAQKILRAQKQPPCVTLFFGNLGFQTTEGSLREMLEAHQQSNTKTKGKKKKEDAEDSDEEEEEKVTKKPDPFIRKVRLGTFEDSGKCKGFGFVDFTSVENATACLIDPRNHRLDGRQLVVEYASAEAVRRGQPKERVPKDKTKSEGGWKEGGWKDKSTERRDSRPRRDGERQPRDKPRTPRAFEGPVEDVEPEAEAATEARQSFGGGKWGDEGDANGRGDAEGRHRPRDTGKKWRPKPGAALALAKRESTAIVPSEGKKIMF